MPTVVSLFGVKPNRIGGTETFARELSMQLDDRGWNSVLCFESSPPVDVATFLDLPNVSLEVLKHPTNFNVAATWRLAQILRLYKPDILHLHFVGFIGVYPWLATLLSVRKVFFTDHSSRPAGYEPMRAAFWKRRLVRIINYPITKVICVSKFGRRCMQTLDLLPDNRYELVYNGVDLSRVVHDPARARDFRSRYAIPEQKRLVVQISWIIPEKGIGDLLDLAKLVTAQRSDIQFVIVGEGPYRKAYMQKAEQMGLSESITWTGLMKDPFGEGVFDAADVVCQLSQWEEVFGWMIAEAMAFGKPVVATRVGGIPELVENGESGFIQNRRDLENTAFDLIRILESKDLREKMGRAGYQKTKTNFNLSTNVRQLLDAYGLT
jgi:glycosyltransferase involved in cell wall biosynthesis